MAEGADPQVVQEDPFVDQLLCGVSDCVLSRSVHGRTFTVFLHYTLRARKSALRKKEPLWRERLLIFLPDWTWKRLCP
jgi:hypothetical protein